MLGVGVVALWLGFVQWIDRISRIFEPLPLKLVRQSLRQNATPIAPRLWLAATEPTRWVVSVSTSQGRVPLSREFFAVDRTDQTVSKLEDASACTPQGLR